MTFVNIADVPSAVTPGARRRPAARVHPEGIWGPWLVEQRLARKRDDGQPWTQSDAFEFLRGRFGWGPTSRPAYVALEHNKGSRIERDAELQRILLEAYGAEPPKPASETVTVPEAGAYLSRIDDLAAALAAQTAALSRLADQVRALAEAQPTGEDLANVLSGAVALAIRETLQASGLADGPRQS